MKSAPDTGAATTRTSNIPVLDLSFPAQLPPDLGGMWDEIAAHQRAPFAELIDGIAAENHGDIDWWVSGPATRNEYLSPLFHNLVSVLFVCRLVASGRRIDRLILASQAAAAVLRRALPDTGPRTLAPVRGAMVTGIRRRLSVVRSAAWFVARHFALSAGSGTRGDTRGRSLLVDVFVIPGAIETDRYYPGLWENLPEDCRSRVCFVPHVHGFPLRRLREVRRTLERGGRPVLMKEDYLNTSDLLFCLGHRRRLKQIRIPPLQMEGLDMTDIVKEDLSDPVHFRNALLGLANYRFARNLSRRMQCETALDWYENQPLDKGWNLGFRRFHAGGRTVGYLGFHTATRAYCPLPRELADGVTPQRIAVMGGAFADKLRLHTPEVQVFTAPAFRYQWLWESAAAEPGSANAVLVLLPIDRQTAEFIVALVLDMERGGPFIIKEHPALRLERLDRLRAAPQPDLRIDDRPVPELLGHTGVVVCGGGTTAGLEALASGVPVVFVAPPGRLLDIDVPGEVATEMYAIAQDRESLSDSLAEFRARLVTQRDRWRGMAAGLKERFFARQDDGLLRELVGCRQDAG